MFAGMILAQPKQKRHVPLEFCEADPNLADAFKYAGQGKLHEDLLTSIAAHKSVVYLQFDGSLPDERQKLIEFSEVIRKVGGLAPKSESAGIAHTWECWLGQLRSDNPFDWYRTVVVLIGDDDFYYSCGMHQFSLPDVEVTRSVDSATAADLMNRFNYWRIVEKPQLGSGHTFSITADAPVFRMQSVLDARHNEQELFHNPQGLWRLERAERRA
jgi:hypothetical protein